MRNRSFPDELILCRLFLFLIDHSYWMLACIISLILGISIESWLSLISLLSLLRSWLGESDHNCFSLDFGAICLLQSLLGFLESVISQKRKFPSLVFLDVNVNDVSMRTKSSFQIIFCNILSKRDNVQFWSLIFRNHFFSLLPWLSFISCLFL